MLFTRIQLAPLVDENVGALPDAMDDSTTKGSTECTIGVTSSDGVAAKKDPVPICEGVQYLVHAADDARPLTYDGRLVRQYVDSHLRE